MSQNLTLGRGKVYFDLYNILRGLTGERYVGNTPEFSLNASATTLDHFNSDEGLKVKDESVILQLDRKGAFKTDEVNADNLSLFLIASKQIQTQTAVTAPTGTSTFLAVVKDRYYQLGMSAGNPSGVREVASVVVKDDAGTPVTFTVATDYTVDAVNGRIYVVPAGAIVNGTNLVVTYGVAAKSRELVTTNAVATVEGALRFISFNPKGPQRDYYMPYVRLTPNGDFALKGDTWQEIPFNVEILQKDSSTAHIYLDGRAYTP